jgi:uncharacterized protein
MKNQKKIIEAAEQGNIEAQSDLGNLYRREGDFDKSYYWLTKAANQGDSSSMFMLFMNYTLDSKNSTENQDKASYWFKKASEAGYFKDPNQSFSKAENLINEKGVTGAFQEMVGDKLSFLDLVERRAIAGDAKSQTDLGYFYLFGDEGLEIDYEKAKKWLSIAVKNGHPDAHFFLGQMFYFGSSAVDQNDQEAVSLFSKAIELGNTDAYKYLAEYYYFGKVVNQDYQQAFTYFKAAESTDYSAQGFLGEMYYFGRGVGKDLKQAFYYHSKAAEGEDINSQATLGWMYQKGEGTNQDYEKALYWGEIAGKQGATNALQNVGSIYLNGLGVQVNEAKAFQCYLEAAKAEDAEAQHFLAHMYHEGQGTEKSLKDCAFWADKARKNGAQKAEAYWNRFELWNHLEIDGEELYLDKAQKGDIHAQCQLGFYYSNIENDEKAFYWFCQAADQGDSISQSSVGYNYFRGKGVDKDIDKAEFWLLKCSEQNTDGSDYAEYYLGKLYQYERNAIKDAMYWYEKSAARGYMWAQSDLAEIYARGDHVDKDFKKAFELYEKAANQGEVDSQASLGKMYLDGLGVEIDYEKAIHWLNKAIEQNDAYSMYFMGLLYLNGNGVDRSLDDAALWIDRALRNDELDSMFRESAEKLWKEHNLEQYLT